MIESRNYNNSTIMNFFSGKKRLNTVLLLLTLFVIHARSCFAECLEDEDNQSVLGQGFPNHLRDSCAVSDLPSKFGKFKHALLSRQVVSLSDVTRSVHCFILKVLKNPKKLSSLSAVVSTDITKSVTLISSFSCVDRGKSNAESLQLWVAPFNEFKALTDITSGISGAESHTQKLKGTSTDIVSKCLERQIDQTNGSFEDGSNNKKATFRLVEHAGVHDGKGVFFSNFTEDNTPVGPIIPTADLFFRLYEQRIKADVKNEVIYDETSKIPIANGLAFDTGVKLLVPIDVSDINTSSDYRVPATLIMALRSTAGARLEEANVAPGESRTSRVILILSILSTGLPLVLASWLVFKFIADGAAIRFEDLRAKGVNAVIEGHREVRKIDYAQHMLIFVEFFAGLVLLAPLLLAVLDGSANPERNVEVSSGISVFYGSSHSSMSDDLSNPVAGAPFVIVTWVRMRDLEDGYSVSFAISLIAVIFIAALISMFELKRLNCIMPSYDFSSGGFSSMKTFGSLFMFFRSKRRSFDSSKIYKVLVKFRDNVVFDNSFSARPLVMVSERFRRDARKYLSEEKQVSFNRELDTEAARLVEHINTHSSSLESRNTLCLVANVRLTNQTRRSAVLCRSEFYHNNLPREWYYILGSDASGDDTKGTIETYRTTGKFPHDKYLVVARLGLLEHLANIKSIEVVQDHSPRPKPLDADGCKVRLIETQRSHSTQSGFVSTEHDVGVPINCLREGDRPDDLLRDVEQMSPAASSSALSLERKSSTYTTIDHQPIEVFYDE